MCANHGFKFNERAELLIRTHNETLPVTPMRVNNPDRSQLRIHGSDVVESAGFIVVGFGFQPLMIVLISVTQVSG